MRQAENRANVLEVSDLTIALPGGGDRGRAVRGLSFAIRRGEIFCLIGESGSGKSVTASAVMGLLPKALRVEGGGIRLEGEEITTAGADRLRALRGTRMAMIFQEPMTALNPLMKIGEQIAEVIRYHRSDWTDQAVRARVIDLVEDVRLPNPHRIVGAYPFQLSGGQRQRVMIAMALALEPALIIADEPTTALDVTTQAQILRLLRDLQDKHHTAVLFITHDFDVVREIADQVCVMRHGEAVEQGAAATVLSAPQHDYTRMLLDAVPSSRIVPRETPAAPTLVEVHNLSLTFGKRGLFGGGRAVTALDGVSFRLQANETLGVVGESGSGKTTLGRCVALFQRAGDGHITFDGRDITGLSRDELKDYRSKVQVIFQDPYRSLNPRRTIRQSLTEGPLERGEAWHVVEQRAVSLLHEVGLGPEALERFPHQFSGGQRQRISIARALMMQPKLIIADEAVSALDVSVQAQVLTLFETLQRRLGFAMLFVTHDLRVAARLCDRIMVMQRGRCVEIGPPQEVLRHPSASYTRELLGALPGQAMHL